MQVQRAPPVQVSVQDAQVTVQLAPSLQVMTPRSPVVMVHVVPPEQVKRASWPAEKLHFAPFSQLRFARSPPATVHVAEPRHPAVASWPTVN